MGQGEAEAEERRRRESQGEEDREVEGGREVERESWEDGKKRKPGLGT